MIRRKWKFVAFLTLLSVILVFYACKDTGSDAPAVPAIRSISPTMGPTGTAVTISGSGFGASASANKVTFNGILAEISSVSENSIEATVPEGATSGAVAVVTGGMTAVGPNFTVEEEMPGITAVEPDSGTAGTQVTISGMNFSPTPSENIVIFNSGIASEVLEATETKLVTEVPAGAESGPIQLEVSGQRTQSPFFDVITTGVLEADITTTGPDPDDFDTDGYTLNISGVGSRSVTINETVSVPGIEEGTYKAELDGIMNTCSIFGDSFPEFSINAGDTTQIGFQVKCKEILKNQLVYRSDETGDFELYAINPDGTGKTRLTDDPEYREIEFEISPDGTQIAYFGIRSGMDNMFLMDADGSNKVNLTDNLIQGRAPAFSRDGSRIAFQGSDGTDSEIYIMSADKSGFPINVSSNTTDDKDPDFSPAEDKIVYANFDDVDVEYELYTVYADGSNTVKLTDGTSSEDPVFSPDGSLIAFAANEGGVTDNEIYIIHTTGRGGVTQLTDNSENDNRPVFSPDGSVVAFHGYDGGDWEIYVANSDGSGSPLPLTDNSANDFFASWSPDGTQIAYYGHDGSDNEIFVMDADGSGSPVNITDNTANDRDVIWSPVQ